MGTCYLVTVLSRMAAATPYSIATEQTQLLPAKTTKDRAHLAAD